MVIFLQFQFQRIKSYSIKKSRHSGIKLLAGLFFLVSLFFSGKSFAAIGPSLGSATVTPTSSTICAGDSTILTVAGINGGAIVGGPWSATYQWDSSSNGVTWFPIAGATGTISASDSTATYNTSGLGVTTFYRVTMTGTGFASGSSLTTNTVTVNVTPVPGVIHGSPNICQGSTNCFTDATAGGVWSSTNTSVATVGTSGCVFGVATGIADIVYTGAGGCAVIYPVTINATAAITGPSSVCVGNTILLTDATAGVTWSSLGTAIATVGSSSGVVTGISGGAVSIVATSVYGCLAIKTINVNTNPSAITGSAAICIGATNCLTDVTAGGTWSSSNTSVATVGSSGCVFGAGLGTATISYTLSTTCFITTIVTINPLPSAISGNVDICQGSTSTLSDATGGGTWSSLNTSVATVNSSGVVTGVNSGTATIVYTSAAGCIVSVVATVNPLASITGDLSVCLGLTTTLSDAATGGTWSVSNTTASIGSSSGIVTGSFTPGIDTVTYTLPFGCTATAAVTIDPNPAAITGVGTICVGYTTALTDAGGGTWSSGTPTVAFVGSGTGIVTGVTAGTSIITYTLPTGCTTTTIVTVNPLSPIGGTMNVCVNATTSLTDATAGGVWSSSNTSVATISSTGTVTGITAGTATISYTLGSGCSATTVVTVNPLPGAILGNLYVCAWGGTTSLSDSPAGGDWSSTLVVVNTTGEVTGYDTGVGIVSYTLPTGCMITASVTVNPLPDPIMGNTTVCVGSTTTLSDVTPGGTWGSSNTSVATIGAGTGIVTGVSNGTTEITFIITATGCTADTSILVNPLPSVITGTGTVCVGLTTPLTDATAGGTWSSSNNGTATVGSTGIVTGVNPAGGTVTITYTLPTGCYQTSVVTVNPNPPALTGPTAVCVGSTITLVDGTVGGTWSLSNTSVASVDGSGDVTGIVSGTSTLTYTLGTGCITTTVITVNPISAVLGNGVVCVGSTTSLSDASGGGTWSSSNTAIATIGLSSGIVTGISNGTATIVYTTGSGCTANTVVTVNPLPAAITGVETVCVGQTTTLSSTTAGGNWSSSSSGVAQVGATGIVTGESAGTAIISYTLLTGCQTTAIVTVYPLSGINGTLSVCQGSTISLSDATAGGTWSSNNTSVGTVSGTGTVTGISGGTATISYILPTGCFATAVVTVNALGPVLYGNVAICVGFTVILSDAATGGTWSSSNTSVATVNEFNGTVTGGPGSGTATITYSLPSGCSATTVITVNALASITGPGSVCQGSTITLSDLTGGGTWSSSNPGVGTISSTGVFDGINSGTTIVSYFYTTSCYTTHPVIVNPMTPILGVTSVCPGLSITLSDTTAGGTWSSSNTIIATVGSTTGIVFGAQPGTVTIMYVVPTGCSATTTVTVDIVYPITGNLGICLGGSTNLSDITTGGTWSSSNTSVATVNGSGTVTSGATLGTANITYTQPGGCIAVVTVTVNPYPLPITGPTQVCVGGTITLSDATLGGIWSSTEVDVTGSGNIAGITGVVAGNATVTYELTTGCSVYYSLTVNPLPNNINGILTVCQGLTTTLSDPPGGGTWSATNGNAMVNLTTGVVTGVTAGLDTIIFTLPTGCSTDTAYTVNPLPSPITGVASVCYGLTTSLSDATSFGTWSSGNTLMATVSPTGIVTGTGAAGGTVTITYTLNTGCINSIVVTVNPLPNNISGPGSVCRGQEITLTDAGGGTWTSTNTAVATIGSSTGVVFGVSAGASIITYTLGTGCIITTTIDVNPLSQIAGNMMVCVGLTTTLTDSTAGGTWSSSNTSIATIGGTTGTVTGVVAGTSTIFYIMPATGCTSTAVVTVNPLPGPIQGILTVCATQTTSLTDAVGGGIWSSSNTTVATINSSTGLVTGQTAGTSTITYSLGSGCIETAVVTVNPLAPINGSPVMCVGQTSSFSDVVAGTWSSSNTSIATINSSTGLATGISAGTATIVFVTGAGCTTSIIVTVNPIAPINGTTDLCEGVTTIFTDAVTGGTWSSSNTVVATVTTVTGEVTGGSTSGTATISYTMPSGCFVTLTVTVNALPAINGQSSVCRGDSISLTDATLGGVWSTSNSLTITVSSTGEVNGVNSGTGIVSYTYGPSCFVIKSISVDPSTPIDGNLNVCLGLTTTLTDSTLGGAWSVSNTNISIVPEGTILGFETVLVTGVNVGTTIISYTLPTGCTRTAVVTVNMTAAITGTDSVCVGLTTTLSDATAGVTWTSSNTSVATVNSTTGVVTGVNAGTATITATSPVGCINTTVVTVNPLPSAILGNPVVCVGLTTTLSDLTTPGTWSSSNTSVATISAAGVMTGIAAGTATITWTLPTGCIATVIATVNPLPAAISGVLDVCVGLGTILTDASGGGTWSASNGNATVGEFTGVVIGVNGGTNGTLDTITYTLGTGCIITAVVTINPLPSNIQGNPNICLYTTNILSDSTTGGTWSSSNTSIASLSAGSGEAVGVTGNILGSATITYTLPTGCITTLAVSVDPLPLAITGIDSVCVGSVTSLSDPTFGGTWTVTNTLIATIGSSSGIVTGVSADTVTVIYTLSTACNVTTVVTVNPLPSDITGNFNVCIGTSNTLADVGGGTWTSSNTSVATVGLNTGVVSGLTLGTATITYTLITGCFTIQVVTVDPLPTAILGIDSVCVGSTTSLTDATAGGTWTSSQTTIATIGSSTGVVTGQLAGTTIITYQLTGTGCINTTVVTVNPLPAVITGNDTVCVGLTITLTDATAGGVWTSSNTSASVVDSTGIVTGLASDTSTGTVVTITYTLPTGCFTTYNITVFPSAPAIVGPDSVCVGSTVTLSEPPYFGGAWSSSLPGIATISSEFGIVTGISSGTTTITYSSNHGCITTTVMTVNAVPTPIYSADSVCNGFSVQLNDTSAGGVWTTTNPGIDTISTTGIVTGISPGTDSVLYTYPITGCSAYLKFTVHPIPVITASSSDNGIICLHSSVTLFATGAGPSAPPYIWTPTSGLSPITGSPITASPSVTTTYTVVGTTKYGCSSFDTVTVHVDSLLLHLHITGKDSICDGTSDTLIASPRYPGAPLFTWTPAEVSNVHGDTVSTTISATTTFTVTLIDSFGCSNSAMFTVTVNPLPIISVSPNPAFVCRGTPLPLHATGAASYAWYPDAFLSCYNCANPVASDTQNLVYKITGTSQYGCVDSILFPVSVLDTTKITISNDTALCAGQCANLLVTSTSVDGSHPISYTWSPTNGLNDPSSPFPTACPDTTTLYTVIVKENACFSDTSHVTVFVEPYPAINLTATPGGIVLAGQPVTLSATITNNALLTNFVWNPALGLSCDTCYDPIATPSTTTTYTFTATSNYGCVSYDTITIGLKCGDGQVFIPNTFTPNGDGHNDRFWISGTGIATITSLRIYNRWGELMFQSTNTNANDPGAGWDGTYKGVVLEPDVFVYVAQVTCELGGAPFNFKGNVSLVR